MASSGQWRHGLESQVFKGRVLQYEIQKWLACLLKRWLIDELWAVASWPGVSGIKGTVLNYELSLSAKEVAHWRALGSGFMAWSLSYLKGGFLEYEIQKWLSPSAEEVAHWRALGSGFMA